MAAICFEQSVWKREIILETKSIIRRATYTSEKKNIKKEHKNALPNGLICLKGGELQHEILPYKNIAELYNLSDFFKEEFFLTKKGVYVPL